MFGPGAQPLSAASQKPSASDEDVKVSIDSFTKVYDIIEQNYADKLSADKAIYKGAIPGMLRDAPSKMRSSSCVCPWPERPARPMISPL